MRMMTVMLVSALTVAVPAVAQDTMSADPMKPAMKPMSAAEMKKMKACNAMTHDKMMKNAGCVKLMKAHPDMMKHDMMMPKSK